LSEEQIVDVEAVKKLLIPLVLKPKILMDILVCFSKKHGKLSFIIIALQLF